MTPEQMRGARALLGWTVRELAERASVTANTISRLENGGDAKASTLKAIRDALEAGGVRFLNSGDTSPGKGVASQAGD